MCRKILFLVSLLSLHNTLAFFHTNVFRNAYSKLLNLQVVSTSHSPKRNYGYGTWREKAIRNGAKISPSVMPGRSMTTGPKEDSISVWEDRELKEPSSVLTDSANNTPTKITVKATDITLSSTKIPTKDSKSNSSKSRFESTSLAVLDKSQLASTAAEAAKLSAMSIAAMVSSLAEATVVFSRSEDAAESMKAAALAGNALSDVGKGTIDALSAIANEWKVTSKELDDVEDTEAYLKSMSKTVQKITSSSDLKSALSKAIDGVKRTLKEITTAYFTVVTSVGTELGTSQSFKDAVAETLTSLKFLLTVLAEIASRTIGEMTARKELPAAD